jgi:hypothetical protein
MGKKKPIFNTLNQIYSDITLFQTRLENNKHIPSSSVLQTVEDLQFAKTLVDFLKSGSYLNLSKSNEESTRSLLKLYRSGLNRKQLADLSGLTPRQIYYANLKVEESLESRFPTGLLSLWKNRQFQVIEEYLQVNSDDLSSIIEEILEFPLVQFAPRLLGQRTSELYRVDLIKEKSKEEIIEALEKVLEMEKRVTQTLLENLEDIKVWGSLTRYLTLNKTFPADLVLELQKKNFPNLNTVEFERVEGV